LQGFDLSKGGKFERIIPLPIRPLRGLAVDHKGNLFMGNWTTVAETPETQFPIVKMDSLGNVITGFGTLPETSLSEVQNMIRNARYLALVDHNHLIAVPQGIPLIEKYTLEGELIISKDLSQTPFFAPRMASATQVYAESPKAPIGVQLFQYIEVYNSILYMLIIRGEHGGEVRANTLLAVDTESLELVGAFKLADHEGQAIRWGPSFIHTSRGELLVYSARDGVFFWYDDPLQSSS